MPIARLKDVACRARRRLGASIFDPGSVWRDASSMQQDDPFDFSHLDPVGTIEHVLEGVHVPRNNPEPVVLELRHAGDGNERYKKAMKNAAAKGKIGEVEIVALFAKTVVVGWKNVKHLDGKDMPFSPNAATELLSRLLDHNRGDIVSRAYARAAEADRFVRSADDLGKP